MELFFTIIRTEMLFLPLLLYSKAVTEDSNIRGINIVSDGSSRRGPKSPGLSDNIDVFIASNTGFGSGTWGGNTTQYLIKLILKLLYKSRVYRSYSYIIIYRVIITDN